MTPLSASGFAGLFGTLIAGLFGSLTSQVSVPGADKTDRDEAQRRTGESDQYYYKVS